MSATWASTLRLAPHPEGGWFRETWRSDVSFVPDGYPGSRACATAIYFALEPGEKSRWHVVRSDEIWLWHTGGPLTLRLGGNGSEPDEPGAVARTLGPDLAAGFLAAWLTGTGTAEALAEGARLGARAVATVGARPR